MYTFFLMISFQFKVDAENVQRELEMLSQSKGSIIDSKINPTRGTNGDEAGHSESNGFNSAMNAGKALVNGLPGIY